jgi:LysM repeat protein
MKKITITILLSSILPLSAHAESVPSQRVSHDDSQWSIPHRYHANIATLQQENGLMPSAVLVVGKDLKIPAKGEAKASRSKPDYIVKKGDTLGKIAEAHKVSASDLQKWNHLGDPRKLRSGSKLVMSAPTPSPNKKSSGQDTTPTPARVPSKPAEVRSEPSLIPDRFVLPPKPINEREISPQIPPLDPNPASLAKTKTDVSHDRPIIAAKQALPTRRQSATNEAKPAEIKTAEVSLPFAVRLTKAMSFKQLADAYGMSVKQLNTVNHWDIAPDTMLDIGAEAVVFHGRSQRNPKAAAGTCYLDDAANQPL